MENVGFKNPNASLLDLGIRDYTTAYWNLNRSALVEHTIKQRAGYLTDTGALKIHTGGFTGRTPKDRWIVKDDTTTDTVDWGNTNKPFTTAHFNVLRNDLFAYFKQKSLYVRDNYACADAKYRLNIRTITELPWSSLFADNMFLRLKKADLQDFTPDWTIICAPGFHATPSIHGTNRHNFVVMNFAQKQILIGGTGYTGEIKKGIFSVLNFELPLYKKVLSMHSSANIGMNGETAVFFGLSGTGKTTLSADPNRRLIGDDEHGWSNEGVFNFEGGCYAKTINLSQDKEPEIFNAIKFGAILENINFLEGTRTPDYADKSITENTRVSYPIEHIPNCVTPSKGGHPKHIFFLTCDAFGVLPPISKLTRAQAEYHFISGYTAKIPGTEDGVSEPETTFSACFGSPFMPLHATHYADLLGTLMEKHDAQIWLVNTGWVGGEYGKGLRIKLSLTRAMITAALNNQLEYVDYKTHEIFGLLTPTTCPGLADEKVLDPRQLWVNKEDYDQIAQELSLAFTKNFEKFEAKASEAVKNAGPKVVVIS